VETEEKMAFFSTFERYDRRFSQPGRRRFSIFEEMHPLLQFGTGGFYSMRMSEADIV